MRRYGWVLFVMVVTMTLIVGCKQQKDNNENENVGNNNNTEQSDVLVEKAESFIQLLSDQKFEKATESFDANMKLGLSSVELEEIWETLHEQAGKIIDQTYKSTEEKDGYQVVLIEGLFEGGDLLFIVTFDQDEKIAGFHIQ